MLSRSKRVLAEGYVRFSEKPLQLLKIYGNDQYDLFDHIKSNDYHFHSAVNKELAVKSSEGKIYPRDFPLDKLFMMNPDKAVTVVPRPIRIYIKNISGVTKEVEIASDEELKSISKKEESCILVDSYGWEVEDFGYLKEYETYHYLKQKVVKFLTKEKVLKDEVFKSQSDLNQFYRKGLYSDDLDGEITKFSEIVEGNVYYAAPYQAKPITIVSSHESRGNSCLGERQTFFTPSEFRKFLKSRRYTGLVSEHDRKTLISFESMIPDKTYFAIEKFCSAEWISKAKTTMDQFAVMAFKAEIGAWLKGQNLDCEIEDKARYFYSKADPAKFLQAYDRVLYVPSIDSLFLLDCRHIMRRNYLRNLKKGVDGFIEMLQSTGPGKDDLSVQQHQFKSSYRKIYGIACGELFSSELRKEAESLGLLVTSEGNFDGCWKFEKLPF
jgi:hypothetical protein